MASTAPLPHSAASLRAWRPVRAAATLLRGWAGRPTPHRPALAPRRWPQAPRPPRASGGGDEQQAATPDAPNSQSGQQGDARSDNTAVLGSVGLFLLWVALAGYAAFVAPNQTPLRDSYFLEKLVGLGVDDGVQLNIIVQQLFLIMGVWPLVYTQLLIPSGKSGNGVPAWPFVTASYAIGAFGLLPFMALWQPPKEPPRVPAGAEELQGPGNLMQKGMESPLVAALCLVGAVSCIAQAALAGPQQWDAYFKLLEESRFINVMTVDFLALTSLAPFWLSNDAELRRWPPRDALVPVLSVLPVLGPVIYLCLRPRAQV